MTKIQKSKGSNSREDIADNRKAKNEKAWMQNLSFVIGGLLVLLVFCAYCYWGILKEENRYIFYMKEKIGFGEIRRGTPEGEIRIPIPESVKSREEFIVFCMLLLDDSRPRARKIASEYLSRLVKRSDPVYDSLQQKIWELCNSTKQPDILRDLIIDFTYLVDEHYTDEIIVKFKSESDRHVRAALLGCLWEIGDQKSIQLLKHIALDSSNSDDAYNAACEFTAASSPQAIPIVTKYLQRADAKKGIIAGPPLPVQLKYMKRRLSYRIVSLILIFVFPVLVFLAHRQLKKRGYHVSITILVIAEIILLLGYFLGHLHYMAAALGGGDTGAFSHSYRETMNYIFLFFLLCLYIVNVFTCQKYSVCIRMLIQNKLTRAVPIKGNAVLAIFFVNVALILSYFDMLIHYFP